MLEGTLEIGQEIGQYLVSAQIKSSIRNVSGQAYNNITGAIPPTNASTPQNSTVSELQNPGQSKSSNGVAYTMATKNAVGLAAKLAIGGNIATVVATPLANLAIKGKDYTAKEALIDASVTTAGLSAAYVAGQLATTAVGAYILSPIAIPYAGFVATSVIAGVAGQYVKNWWNYVPPTIEEFPQVTKNWLADNDYPHLCLMRDEFIAQVAKIKSMAETLTQIGTLLKENTPDENSMEVDKIALENAKLMLAEYKSELEKMVKTIPQIVDQTQTENEVRKNEYGNTFKYEIYKQIASADSQILQIYYEVDAKISSLGQQKGIASEPVKEKTNAAPPPKKKAMVHNYQRSVENSKEESKDLRQQNLAKTKQEKPSNTKAKRKRRGKH